MNVQHFRTNDRLRQGAVLRAAVAGALAAAAGAPAMAESTDVPPSNGSSLRRTTAGVTPTMPTISISGSTAMRNFTISEAFSRIDKTPGSSITLGPAGDAITYSLGSATVVQLASGNVNAADAPTGTNQTHSGMRIEWHEQGSVEGVLELVDSQIADIYSNEVYNPTSGNGTFVNRIRWGGTTGGTFSGNAGPSNSAFQGFRQAAQPAGTNFSGPGVTNTSGQNRVQMAISDVSATQGFSVAGTPALSRAPGQPGYGKGNPVFPGIGSAINPDGTPNTGSLANTGRQLRDQSVLNMVQGAADPQSGGTYGAGPWNNGGTANLRNEKIAITATTFAANPGTGLTKVNRADAQFLQTTGRLGNGADFNVATRDVNSGTLNVAALNAGVDPSWAVGENDGGNGNQPNGGTAQVLVGPGMTFSNKTAGGAQLRPLVQRSRMALGHLSLSDAIGVASATGTNVPVRILGYRDDVDDVANGNNGAGSFSDGTFSAADPATGTFARPDLNAITGGEYALYQNQTYVTVRTPDANYNSASTIKGDNTGNDVRDVIDNIKNSVGTGLAPANVASPAEGLISQRFIPPQLMKVEKSLDGIGTSTARAFNAPDVANFRASAGSLFNFDAPENIKQGNASAVYGAGIKGYASANDPNSTIVAPAGGNIPITNTNYLFGDFNQASGEFDAANTAGRKGIRDLSDLYDAVKYQRELEAGGSTTWDDAADLNNRSVAPAGLSARSKGDLIVMGDYDSDGRFDGRDLKRFAVGAALVDASANPVGNNFNDANSRLTTATADNFGDMVRKGKLVKNAALDYLQANADATQKAEASADGVASADDVNAFNKFDVNGDGSVNRQDGAIVNAFVGKSYTNLDHQLAAVVATNVNAAGTAFPGNPLIDATTPRKSISLVAVELTDNGLISHVSADGTGDADQSDFELIRKALGSASLLDGDVDFSGGVSSGDLGILLNNFNGSGIWSTGDFNFDGQVTSGDLGLLLNNFGGTAASNLVVDVRQYGLDFEAYSLLSNAGITVVPEPSSAAVVLAAAGLGVLARRRRGGASV